MTSVLVSLSLPLGALLALILIAVRATGPARRTGLVGAIVLLVGAVLNTALSLFGGRLISRYDQSLAVFNLLQTAITVLNAVGLIVVAVAIGRRLGDERPGPVPPRS